MGTIDAGAAILQGFCKFFPGGRSDGDAAAKQLFHYLTIYTGVNKNSTIFTQLNAAMGGPPEEDSTGRIPQLNDLDL